MKPKVDYSKLSDKELLSIVDPKINKGPIPLSAVTEAQKRRLKKKTKLITNS